MLTPPRVASAEAGRIVIVRRGEDIATGPGLHAGSLRAAHFYWMGMRRQLIDGKRHRLRSAHLPQLVGGSARPRAAADVNGGAPAEVWQCKGDLSIPAVGRAENGE
jgi:hypothetical protein